MKIVKYDKNDDEEYDKNLFALLLHIDSQDKYILNTL